MDFVLDEEIDQGNQSPEKGACEVFPVFNSLYVFWAQCQTTNGPRKSCNEVRDHENVMPIVIIGGGNVGPSSACECSKKAHECNEFRKCLTRPGCEEVP